MSYSKMIIKKVKKMRREGLSLNRISKKTNIPKTTIYHWIRNLPIPIINGENIRVIASRNNAYILGSNRNKICKRQRQIVYNETYKTAKKMFKKEPLLRDFVNLYLAEGGRSDRYSLSLTNTDIDIIKLCLYCYKKLSDKKIYFRLHCYGKRNKKFIDYWAKNLNINKNEIKVTSKGTLKEYKNKKRKNLKSHGVFVIRLHSFLIKEKVLALIDYLKKEIWPRG